MAHLHKHGTVTGSDSAAMAELLDLAGEVLHAHLSGVLDWVHELAGDLPRQRIVDLGCGTGTGTVALLRRFDDATVLAVDESAAMLDRVRDRTRELGLADRVHTVQADLDLGWPAMDPVDLVWAAASMHHMADPDRVLG